MKNIITNTPVSVLSFIYAVANVLNFDNLLSYSRRELKELKYL